MRYLLIALVMLLPLASAGQNNIDLTADSVTKALNKTGQDLQTYYEQQNLSDGLYVLGAFTSGTAAIMDPGTVRTGTFILSGVVVTTATIVRMANDKHIKRAGKRLRSLD